MSEYRPDPDKLLAAVQKNENRQQRGKLKIFFGMAAGVGKTYTMLDYARQRKAEGVDVVVGYVETHKRAETEALLHGLEVISRQKLDYRGTTIDEMNTDAILARKPALVLVDELAHTNAPGARHLKRYQDVIELLEAGLNVWTTVNVQHFESRADTVRQITGITVQETVPDSILEYADEIELIDLSPDDLRKRLAEGKVYTADRVETAASNFFRTGNLTALREMALRLTAEHVDHQLHDYMQVKSIPGPWKSGEHLMVAVGPSPFSEQLIRWTRRIAYNLEAPWIAVYIETPSVLSPEAKARLADNLALARDLGGEVLVSASSDLSGALLQIARQRNVTQVVVGKPMSARWQRLYRGGSLVDKLVASSGDIDIFVVTGDKVEETTSGLRLPQPIRNSSWKQYLIASVVIAILTGIDLMALPWLGYQAVGLTELFAVLLIAVYLGRGPALVAAALSAVSWNFLFIAPRFTFHISQVHDVILFIMYFVIAILTGNLTARIRTQERQASYNADRTLALYTLAHEVATAVNMEDVLRMGVSQIAGVFDAQVAILLPQNGKLERMSHPSSTLTLDEKDYSVAIWVFENGKSAGRFTNTLPLATAQFLPLLTPNRTVGVIGIRTHQSERLSFEQEALLETFSNQIALVIERELLDEAAEQAAMLQESERLYTTLLNSISHELRTPIATITGASSGLLDPHTGSSETVRTQLSHDIHDAADRLNRLVENLLDMSRLDSGRLKLKRDWCDVSDVIGVAVKRGDKCFEERPISIHIAPDLPLVRMDFVMMEQVLVNLLDNACNYTPVGTQIELSAAVEGQWLTIAIADNGQGLPPQDVERVFEKFYRVPGTATGGTGLGLSICRGLVEAHGGTLTASNQPSGGARFLIRIPADTPPPPVREAAL
ncbi:MAG: sensor histidine kinase KdpD [Chloroflexi bacterium]|nr:sensor histidine kinase KdpD [Chloroflexota bacterium]MCC6896665.1 sensor histidine kinase KdpD [Anaerolineae bacterium]